MRKLYLILLCSLAVAATAVLFFKISYSCQPELESTVLRGINTSIMIMEVFPMVSDEKSKFNDFDTFASDRIEETIRKRTRKNNFNYWIFTISDLDKEKFEASISDRSVISLSVFEYNRNFYFFAFPINTGDQENLSKEVSFERFITELSSNRFHKIFQMRQTSE